MGVPAFFRWISEKYKGALRVIPYYDDIENACDWLHLDLNALIHPCTHPEFGPQPKNDEERFQATCEYIETMVKLSKPRKGIFIAMDGVAPVAKMQQQRIRRYRAVEMKKMSKTRFQKLLEFLGVDPEIVQQESSWDYNVITPGTPFMQGLAEALREYFHKQLETSKLWNNLQVILSDSNEPGEGEHKIMRFLRSLRSRNYDMEMQHIVFSPDADMIPLLLCSHLPKVKVLRPKVAYRQKDRLCDMCWEKGHPTFMCTRNPVPLDKKPPPEDYWTFDLNLVREYLYIEMHGDQFDFEQIIEDFVFLTFLVGNDFLHHLPGFGIRDGALDLLMNVWNNWKKKHPTLFLTTSDGDVDWNALGKFFKCLAPWENKVFAYAQKQSNIRDKIRKKKKDEDQRILEREANRQQLVLNKEAAKRFIAHHQDRDVRREMRNAESSSKEKIDAAKASNPAKDPKLQKLEAQFPNMDWGGVNASWFMSLNLLQKKKFLSRLSRRVPDHLRPPDNIKYGSEGWKKRYYLEKFKFDVENPKIMKQQIEEQTYKVLVGLRWNFGYYRSGCPSWTWGYESAYSPAVTDIVDVFKRLDIDRINKAKPPLGAPIEPFVQLMCVLPPGTVSKGYALPKPLQDLVCDEESEVSDLFHRIQIENDYEHAFEHWQAITKVPFPEVERIEEQAQKLYHKCSEDDLIRNKPHEAKLFIFSQNPIVDILDTGVGSDHDILPFNVLFNNSASDDMIYVDQHVNGFVKVVQKKDNIFSCLYRPFMYIEDRSIIQSVPRPQNILTEKQLKTMRSSRRYGTFDMHVSVRPPKRRQKQRQRFRKTPVQDHWVPGRGSSPEFEDNLSSEEEVQAKSPNKEAILEGLDFLDKEDRKQKPKSQRRRSGATRNPHPKAIPAIVPDRHQNQEKNQSKNNNKKPKSRRFKAKQFNTENPKPSRRRRSRPHKKASVEQETIQEEQLITKESSDEPKRRNRHKNGADSKPRNHQKQRANGRRRNHRSPNTQVYGNVSVDNSRANRSANPYSRNSGMNFAAQQLYSDLAFNEFTVEPQRFANADMQPGHQYYYRRNQYQDPNLFGPGFENVSRETGYVSPYDSMYRSDVQN